MEGTQGMSTASPVSMPATKAETPQRRWNEFVIPPETFKRFELGRNKFERWSKFLDISDPVQKELYDYAKAKPNNTIVLRCAQTGAVRGIRRRCANGS